MIQELQRKGELARQASRELICIDTNKKDQALYNMAQALTDHSDEILAENQKDVIQAKEKGITGALIDRLTLTVERIEAMKEGILKIRDLEDPIGQTIEMTVRPNGLEIGKKRVPIGVIGIIYEARPNVTADAAALCLKTSNAVILRGGKEAIRSNLCIVRVLSQAMQEAGLPEGALQILEDTTRETAKELMKMNTYIDMLIPRGGAGLIRTVVQESTVPVIETGTGNCHTYVDEWADLDKAVAIAVNAKCSRPGVCNAMETLLVHTSVAKEFLPKMAAGMEPYHVELRGCQRTCAILPGIRAAQEEDYATEFLDYILAVKVVDSLDEAIAHISRYSSGHSEAIVTESYTNARRFQQEVDAAAVYANASTRFTDGFEFGFGAEIGISTQKMHARGPMGLEALTSIKYVVSGDGQTR